MTGSRLKPKPSSAIRALLVDDHPAVRRGLALLLETEGIVICGETSGRAEALESADECRPDIALVDLSLGEEDGLCLVADLRDRVPCLVYSMYEDAHHVEGAFKAGALGYVTKREIHRVLLQAIGEVAAGRRFVSPNAAVALANNLTSPVQAAESRLSAHERQVYFLLGQGESTPDIAAAMGISARTVESYYARILEKLSLEGMHELRRHAIARRRQDTA